MQAHQPTFHHFVALSNRWWRRTSCKFRAFCSSSPSSDYSNQSRGGLPRFFSDVLPPSKGGVIRVQGDEFWHMTKVLRLSTNDRVELFNGKGGLVRGNIQSVDRAGLDFVSLEDPKLVPPQRPLWHVFAAFGTLKGGRADWLVEKCTELGASSVTPLLTDRSPSVSENRFDRLQRLILAASKQCQRLHEMVRKSKLSLLAVAEAPSLMSALTSCRMEPDGIMIIGPEGDFTEKEVSILMEAGATAVGLGPHRLRVETATIALLATLMLWSDHQVTKN
ncbi:ribosomal RNA small subunit methyltransferase E isoform X2 [Rhodamnia argentea]|uniref:16S rRNA (uracil(1498)-N(3))-methyltransferase n=1 Tax=Rhodamnia argentea TaxID=178133 RepID=A0ABM3GV66_9MYRT|nr:ribosomal RNA small subunit methyltransferase E isoform X2 [Rhodamnia argentea]